jgi:hypothetical protein
VAQEIKEKRMLQSGDFVVMTRGIDDVADGQICKVLADDEYSDPYRYGPRDAVAVLCWTGYLAWTPQDNLIPIAGNSRAIDALFRWGGARTGSACLQF